MYSKILRVVGVLICLCNIGVSQNNHETYDLNECIRIALENNLDLKSATLRANSSQVDLNQAKGNFLPNIGMNYNFGVNNGRNINPVTNDFINERLTFSNVGLNLDAVVFNGFRLKNRLEQNKFYLKAAEMEIEEAKQSLVLDVTLRYIQILNARAQLKLSKTRIETTQGQMNRLESNFNEGVGNPADFTDMQGQYAIDEMSVVTAQNDLQRAILDLFALLNIEPEFDASFDKLDGMIQESQYVLSAEEVYQNAIENLAAFKAKELRIDAETLGVKAEKSSYLPQISVFGQLNTRYSSAAKSVSGTSVNETGSYVNLDNQELPVFSENLVFSDESIGYRDQFNNNFNSVFGVAITVPILSRLQTRNAVALQKIRLKESTVDLENTQLLFRQAIKDAHLSMEAAFNRYQILTKQVAAYEQSYRVNEIRFENGVSNIVEYLTSKNNLDAAQLNLSNAKYEYILRVKVLDYYRGL